MKQRVGRALLFGALLLTRPPCVMADQLRFTSNGHPVACEVFGATANGPLLIYLHGASGPDVPLYREQAQFFADHGYVVLLVHYFDATQSNMPTDKTYTAWARAIWDLLNEIKKDPQWASRDVFLLGVSLGSSVALAAGSQKLPVRALADWYGSLPDAFFYNLKGMPPLLILHGERDDVIPVINARQLVRLCGMAQFTCESHFYSDQGHGFSKDVVKDADSRTLEFFARFR